MMIVTRATMDLQQKCDFAPVSRCKWDDEYKHDGWDKNKDRRENIIFYKHTGNEQHLSRAEDRGILANFKETVKASADYGVAQNARDKALKKE